MKEKTIEDFKKDCNNKRCNRNTVINKKTCLTDSKQQTCYKKYISMLEKKQQKYIDKILLDKENLQKAIDSNFTDNIDLKWEEVKKKVWERDVKKQYTGIYKVDSIFEYCVVWTKILTKEEKQYILKNFTDDLILCKLLSNLHIESRQRKPELIYNVDNIILSSNYFHDLFDNYFDLVTREVISNEKRELWVTRFKNYIKEN